jgi:carbonic anhydrase
VARARAANPTAKSAELIPAAIRENVWQSIFTILKTSPICRERIAAGELKVVGALYNVADGTIDWMGEHPWQSELITAFSNRGPSKPLAGETNEHR